jgi:hypothetical protein
VAFASVDSVESGAKEEGAALVNDQGNRTRKDKSRITCFTCGKKGQYSHESLNKSIR